MLRKPDTKGHTLYDSIYMKGPEKANTQMKSRLVAARGRRRGE